MPVNLQALQVTVPSATSASTQGKSSPSSIVYMPMSPVAVVSPVQVITKQCAINAWKFYSNFATKLLRQLIERLDYLKIYIFLFCIQITFDLHYFIGQIKNFCLVVSYYY